MIKKITETIDHTIEQTIKETIIIATEEIYYEDIPHTHQIFYGPTGCGKCLHCGIKLTDKMWLSGAKDKYLCYPCWRSLNYSKREEYRQKAVRGYYSTETYYEKERRTRIVKKPKEIEKKIYVTDRQITYPIIVPDIKYDSNNSIKLINIDPYDLQSQIEEHKISILPELQESMLLDELWYGAKDINKLYSNLLTINNKFDKYINEMDDIEIESNCFISIQRLKEYNDIVGFYPNVPAHIQGNPLDMYNNKRVNERSINIFCNLALDSSSDYYQYNYRGIIIHNLINALIERWFTKVNLTLVDATFINGETCLIEIPFNFDDIRVHSNLLYNILIDISFYRVFLLNEKEKLIKQGKLSQQWLNGGGYVIKHNDLRALLSTQHEYIDNDTLIIGSPQELNIGGFNLYDDLYNFLYKLKLKSKPTYTHKLSDIDLLQLKKYLEERGITKLIHVTAEDNLESIEKYGILSIDELQKQQIHFLLNDDRRLENEPQSISLSITRPNYFIIDRFKKRYPTRKYIVLEIAIDILFKKVIGGKAIRRIYCESNAASSRNKRSESDISIMFQNIVREKGKIISRPKDMPQNLTTSTQAEILFFGNIEPQYITKKYEYNSTSY